MVGMKGVTATYDVHGTHITVEAAGAELGGLADTVLKSCATPRPDKKTFLLRVGYGDPTPPASRPPLRVYWSGAAPNGLPMVFRCAPGQWEIELTGHARVRLDWPQQRAEVVVTRGAEWCLLDGCILPLVCVLLGHAGQHVVHAASLVRPSARGSRAILLSGIGGAGKTTTALALAGAGLHLMADDASFVLLADGQPGVARAEPGYAGAKPGVQVWGLPLPCKVHRNTMAMLPWLERLPRRLARTKDEFLIEAARVQPPAAPPVPPGLILFLDPRNPAEHRVQPMDKTSALARLVRENVRAYEETAEGVAGKAFAALAALVRSSATYRVSLSPSLDGLADRIAPLLEA
jgi:hypothetical protein